MIKEKLFQNIESELEQSSNNAILVSAIISAYNSELFIRGCLQDLIEQTLFTNGFLEIIVIDSGSQQNEVEVVKEYQNKYPNIIYHRTERETLYASWNRGIKLARGKYVTNANTDDRHREDALEIMSEYLENHGDVDLVYSDCYETKIENETYSGNDKQILYKYTDYFAPNSLLYFQFGIHPMWRKEVHKKIGYFDESYSIIGDYDFNVRFSLEFKAYHINEPLGLYYCNPDSLSFQKDNSQNEHSNFFAKYRDLPTIYKLYKIENYPVSTDIEKSYVLADLGLRATSFYQPWDLGKPSQDRDFALKCFNEAFNLNNELAQNVINDKKELLIPELKAILSQRFSKVSTKLNNNTNVSTELTKPLISVVIPCYNQAHYLRESVESIINQTFSNWEIIIVNDGSSDNTSEIATELINEYPNKRIRLIEKENGGVSQARNFGIKHAKGDWILPFDSDDKFLNNFMAEAVQIIKSKPEVNIITCDLQEFGARNGAWITEEYNSHKILNTNTFLNSSLFKRALWERSNGYYAGLTSLAEDWNFWIELSEQNLIAAKIPEKLFLYRTTNDSAFDKMLPLLPDIKACITTLHPDLYSDVKITRACSELSKMSEETYIKISNIINKHPDLPMLYLWKGLYLQNKNIATATASFQKALELAGNKNDLPLKILSIVGMIKTEDNIANLKKVRPILNLCLITSIGKIDPQGLNAGLETAVIKTAESLALLGHNVTIAAFLKKEIKYLNGVNYIQFDLWKSPSNSSERNKIDVLAFASGPDLQSYKYVKDSVPKVVLFHHQEIKFLTNADPDILLNKIADGVICVSKEVKNNLKRAGINESRLKVIHNGVDLNVFYPHTVNRNLGRIIFVGALVTDKNPDILIRAFLALEKLLPNIELHLFGTASMWESREYLNFDQIKKLSSKIHFHGAVSHDELAIEYSKSSICVIPSNYESFSLVSLEAQACGCFPIAHDVGGIAETMISGETGLLYSPNKPEILVDHIYGILTRINQFEPNRSKAINWVRENFSWDKTARGYQDYFYELINKKGKLDSNLQVTVNPSSTLVSVIIPCYNHGKYLDDALNSIFAQDYKNYEIIIIDDKSKDDSVHTAEMLINQYSGYNIKLIKLIENKGQACARNTGINAARGKYIITMDADDKIKPSFMSKCIQAFDNNKSIDIVYTDVQNFGNDNIIIPSIDYDPTKLVLFNYITVCSMFSKKMWEEVGGYDETLKGFPFEDWEFWLKAAEYGFIGYHINEPLFNYRKSENESYNSALKNHNIVKAKLISRHPVLFSKEQMKWAELVLGGDKHFIELNKENPGMPFTSDLEQHLQNLALVIKDRQNKRISDTKPRVLFTMYGWNESGGGTTFPKSVVEELVSRGYDVGVFFADLKNDPAQPAYSLDFSVDSGAMLFGIYNRPALFIDPDNPEREIEDEGIRKRFSAVLESFKPDVIHFHNFHGLSFVMAEEANKRAIPTCFTPHNYHIIDPNLYLLHEDLSIWKDVDLIKNSESVRVNPGKIDLYKKRIETTTKLLTEWISVTLCVSNRQKELLKQYCGDDTRFALVHQSSNMVDQLWENPNLSKQSDRRIKKPIRIGFIGSVLPIKGVHYIAVIAQAFDKSDVEFHIYGFTVDAYLNLLKSIDKKGNLVFHGEYHINQLEEIANNIDIAIVPSLLEDCAPLVMLELHALRLPIIGARIGGIPDFIEPEVDGFLYTYDSVEDLLKIINKCVAEPQIIEKMRHNITQKHSFKNYIDHVIKIYIDLAKGMQLKASEYNLIINDSSTKVNKTQMNNYNPPSDSPDESYFEALSDRKIKVGSDRTQAESLKLNLGCGEAIEAGYINIDLNYEGPEIVNMDARILEYEDASVDTILAADLLQCFSHNEIGEVLAEWARVLKPEGKLIISCTSLKQISRLLLSGLINSEIASKLLFGNQLDEAHFYYAAFDEDFLRKELVTAGFTIESYDEANEAESLEDINISIVISAVKSEKHSMPELTNENSTSNQVSSLSFNFGDTHEDIKNVKAEETFDNSLLSGLSFNFDDKGEEAEYEVMEPEQEFDNQDYFAALSDRKLSTDAVVQTVPTDGPQINIVWEGSQFVWHSLALINREICYNIIKSGVAEVTIVPYEPDTFLPEGNPKYEILKQHDIRYKLESDSKTKKLPYSWIRHQWPPKAEEPKGSKWFIIQPWEFSTLRTDFVSIFQNADEVWTPSNYSRNSFINSGIEFDHAQVIPNGCDPELWSPMGKRFKFNTDKKLKFLFVGGTIYRKGIDILLQAYVRTFNGLDNVSLIIKDMGGDSFYAGQTAKNQIDIIQKSENSPEIIYIDDYFTEEQMVELYKACDVFVCPYRGEGFSLPTLEAMASGLPVIVTKGGSTDDFVDESIGWLISADKKSIGREIGGLPLTGEAYLLEPNEDELVETMKSIYGDPSQIFSKGLLASLRARTEWTWKKATIKLLARLDLHNGTTMAKIAEKNLEDYRDDAIALGEIEKKIIAKDSESAYSDLKKLLRNTNMTGRLLHHAYCRMAELCINLMKLDEVDQYLRKAREIYSSIDELYLEANKNFAEEKYSDALDGATKAMQNWKDDKYDSTIGLNIQELLSFTADTLLNDEDPNGALLIYLEVLKLNNNNANAYFGAGISHLKMGSNDDALRMFEWALRINPDYEMAKKMIDGLKITK